MKRRGKCDDLGERVISTRPDDAGHDAGLVQHLTTSASDIPFGMGAASPGAGVLTDAEDALVIWEPVARQRLEALRGRKAGGAGSQCELARRPCSSGGRSHSRSGDVFSQRLRGSDPIFGQWYRLIEAIRCAGAIPADPRASFPSKVLGNPTSEFCDARSPNVAMAQGPGPARA